MPESGDAAKKCVPVAPRSYGRTATANSVKNSAEYVVTATANSVKANRGLRPRRKPADCAGDPDPFDRPGLAVDRESEALS